MLQWISAGRMWWVATLWTWGLRSHYMNPPTFPWHPGPEASSGLSLPACCPEPQECTLTDTPGLLQGHVIAMWFNTWLLHDSHKRVIWEAMFHLQSHPGWSPCSSARGTPPLHQIQDCYHLHEHHHTGLKAHTHTQKLNNLFIITPAPNNTKC